MGDDSWSKDLRASAEGVAGLSGARNSITGLNIGNAENGETLITVGLVQPLANLPAGFTTDDPPRIIFDFPDTTNGLGKSVQDFPAEDLHSANIIQSAGRTRLAINLNRMLSYSTRIEGNNLLIALQGKVPHVAAHGGMRHFAEADPALRQRAY
jgi:type IV pilus assembly protein PilQ